MNFEEIVKKGLKEVAEDSYNKGFYNGVISMINILEDAMMFSNSKVVYPKWLETARKEVEKRKT